MHFYNFELLNLIRHVEQSNADTEFEACAVKVEQDLAKASLSIKEKATERASQLASLTGLAEQYKNVTQQFKLASIIIGLVMMLIGFMSVSQILNGQSQLNIFWLLLLIIGVNTISMIMWLWFIARSSTHTQTQTNRSPLFALYKKGVQFIARQTNKAPVVASWGESHLFGNVGRWFSSAKVHAAWLMYLLGGTLALVLILATKQFDFVWSTTILSQDSFIKLTEFLSRLPQVLGFSVPTTEHIIASELGADSGSASNLRQIWADFILLCITLYAIFPRLILWLLSLAALRVSKHEYQPNWEDSYFYSLRTRLLPQTTSIGIVDADNDVEHNGEISLELEKQARFTELDLPSGAFIAAYEWPNRELPDLKLQESKSLGLINNSEDQERLIELISKSNTELILLVALERAADRGSTRFLQQLSKLSKLYLIACQSTPSNSDAARLAAWHALIERIELPQNRFAVLKMSLENSSE